MKRFRSVIALAAIPLCGPAIGYCQLADSFESYSPDTSIGGQGGWTIGGIDANATVTVSSDEAFSGAQSILVTDNSGTQRPRATYTFAQTITTGTITFAIKEDQNDAGAPDQWTVSFGTFSLSKSTTQLALSYSGGEAGTTPYPRNVLLSNFATYSTSDWNFISITIDGSVGSIAITVNGQIPFSSLTNSAYTWSASRFEASAYAGSSTGDAIYYDAINASQIPEPSAAAALLGLAGVATAALRRGRRSAAISTGFSSSR